MSKREVPKPNKDNFVAWKSLMKLHLGGIRDYTQSTMTTNNVDSFGSLTIDDLKKKKEHNQAMLEIASTLSYVKFDDIKDLYSAKKCGMPSLLSMEVINFL